MALQTIRSIRGNSRCADCEAQSEYRTTCPKQAKNNVCVLIIQNRSLGSSRPGLGESEPGRSDLHRVLGHPQEPGHAPVQGPLPGPGRVAAGAPQSHDGHRQRAGQQRVGGQHPGTTQTGTGRQQVGGLHLLYSCSADSCRQEAAFHPLSCLHPIDRAACEPVRVRVHVRVRAGLQGIVTNR